LGTRVKNVAVQSLWKKVKLLHTQSVVLLLVPGKERKVIAFT
jgi:hypothetical protein